MQKAFFEFDGYKIHYTTIGNGNKYLLAFHGYGQDASLFQAFEDSLGKHYTILSFDLFHHGDSHYPLGLDAATPLPPELMKQMMEQLLNKLGVATFGLMGYSMGGRICLYLAPMFGKRVTELYLFAGDGMKRSYGYMFVTYTGVGKALFRLMVKTGGIMSTALKFGRRIGLMNGKAAAFFITQINSKAKREKLYNAWQTYQLFKPDLDTVAAQINSGQVKLHLFCGKYDKVLPPHTIQRFVKKLKDIRPVMLESGHDLINAKTSAYLQDYLGREPRV